MAVDFDDLDVAESALKYDSITEAELEISKWDDSSAELTLKVIGGLSGDELCWVTVNCRTSVLALKACIALRGQIPASEQRLIAGGVQLCDHEVLGDILAPSDEHSAEVAVLRASAARAKVLDDVKSDKVQLQDLEEEHRGDAEIVLAAFLNHKHALKYAAPAVQQHHAVVLEAVRCHGTNLQYASESLRENHGIVMAAVQQCGEALLHVPEALRSDRQLVIAAVKQDGLVVKHVSKVFKDDFEVALAAVEQNGEALQHVSRKLQRDRKLILAAVKSGNGDAFLHTDKDIRANRDVVKAAVQLQGLALAHASEELRRDKNVVQLAVQSNGLALKHAAKELHGDLQVVLRAVSKHGMALQWVSEELRNDEAVVLAAIRQDKHAIQFVGTHVMTSLSFLGVAEELGIPEDLDLDKFLMASPQAANKLRIKGEALFFDVRSTWEFSLSHLTDAHCLPMEHSQVGLDMVRVAEHHPEAIIFVYSDSGVDISPEVLVARQLRDHLPQRPVLRLAGGLNEWKKEGFPVEGDPSPMLSGVAVEWKELERRLEQMGVGSTGILDPFGCMFNGLEWKAI